MKTILVNLGLVILGVFIVLVMVLGSGSTSMKTGVDNIGTKMSTDIGKATSDKTNP